MNSNSKTSEIALVGAGMVGSLLAIYLARRGFQVEAFEKRPDMRSAKISAGRSINLNISERGFNALRKLGLEERARKLCIPMTGRMIHSLKGELHYQPYGKDDTEFGNSISRADLNKLLINEAESTGKVRIHFDHVVDGINFDTSTIRFAGADKRKPEEFQCRLIMATDGASSVVRDELMKLNGFDCNQSSLDYGYKELHIPPGSNGTFKIEKNALHIWPRKTYMLIALPNLDGSFTCTLFLPWKGPVSFEALQTKAQLIAFFEEQFNDVLPLMKDLPETFFNNPTGHMLTVKCQPWNIDGKALLLGDAAHSIVPFFGQGMNCGFEDVAILDECMERHLMCSSGATQATNHQWATLFSDFFQLRKDNCDAIADMAVENFIEMRDKVSDPKFQLQKAVERILQKEFPGQYISRYSLVTFTNVPYKQAQLAGAACDEILAELCQGITNADEVDLSKAQSLISSKLTPLSVIRLQAERPHTKV